MHKEAFIFSRYLCGKEPSQEIISRYERMTARASFDPSKEVTLQKFILAFPFMLPVLDAALAFFRPRSVIRKKLHIMFALLECDPAHANRFMPGKDSNRGLLYLFFVGTWAVIKLAAGSIFLLFL